LRIATFLGELEQVNTDDATVLLKSLVLPAEGLNSELGVRRDAAYLKFSLDADPSDFAVVWTPGDRWFSLDVAGGFSYDPFEEDTSDADVAQLLERLLDAAIGYIQGRRSTTLSRLLKIPAVIVETDNGPIELRLSLTAAVKRALRITTHARTE
jgi:hypothetical protein